MKYYILTKAKRKNGRRHLIKGIKGPAIYGSIAEAMRAAEGIDRKKYNVYITTCNYRETIEI